MNRAEMRRMKREQEKAHTVTYNLTQAQLDVVIDLLNDRPRKCLGWKTPREVFVALA